MSTTIYGVETSSWYKGYITYSTSYTNTTYTITVEAAGAFCTGNSRPTAGNWVVTLSCTDKSNIRIPTTGNTYYSVSPQSSQNMIVSTRTFTYNRGTTAKDVYVSAAVYFAYGNVTSTPKSDKITIPALASYTVSYNGNGHTGGTVPKSQTKYYGTNITLSSDTPTKTGYTFMGWSTSSTSTSASYQPGGSYTKNESTTLYAIWKKDITLSYDANNGEGAPASQSVTIYNNAANPTFTISSTRPTRTNYDFLGWSLSDIATTASYQPNDSITLSDSDTLYAVWKSAYIPPQITSLQGARLEDNNSQAKITINWTKGNNGNVISTTQLLIAYKLSTSQNWIYVTNTTGSISSTETWINSDKTTYSTTIGTGSNNLTDNQYDIQVKVRNSNYASYEQTKTSFISATFYVIDIAADGKGIGLLTTAPSGGINIGGQLNFINTSLGNNPLPICLNGHNAIFHNQGSLQWNNGANSNYLIDKYTLAYWNGTYDGTSSNLLAQKVDYITAQGTVTESTNGSGLWRYRKWNSGFQEVWYRGSVKFTNATSNSANGWYRRIKDFAIPYDSMTNIAAFDDNAVPIVTGAYSGTLLSTGGFKSSGTAVELQEISGATITSTSITGWSIYIAGMPR